MKKNNPKLRYFSLSFIGRRENNQDSCITISIQPNVHFLAVADGMGGTVGGQIASKIAIDTAVRYLKKAFSTEEPDLSKLKDIIYKMFKAIQISLYNYIQHHPELTGMGTTLACVLIVDDKFVVGNVGDSRVYLVRKGKLVQLTEDHTYITDYRRKTGKEPDANLVVQYGHLLTRSLDSGSDEPDVFPIEKSVLKLEKGDGFLICSDGLVTEKGRDVSEKFLQFLTGTKDLEAAAKYLIADAYHSGSTDNISVVLAEFGNFKRKKVKLPQYSYSPKEDEVHAGIAQKPKTGFKKVLVAGVVIILGFVTLTKMLGINTDTLWNHPKKESIKDDLIFDISADSTLRNKTQLKSNFEWKPFDVKILDYSLSNPEPISWRKPVLQNDSVAFYEVIFLSKYERKELPNIAEPIISNLSDLHIMPGKYKLRIVFHTKKDVMDSSDFINLNVKE